MTTNWRCSHGWPQGNQCPDCEKIASMQAEIDELREKLAERAQETAKVHAEKMSSWSVQRDVIKRLLAENESVRQANLCCIDNFNQMQVELESLKLKVYSEQRDKYDLTQVYTPNCNRHPDAPHGVDEVASYYAGHPVCTCRSWKPGEAS